MTGRGIDQILSCPSAPQLYENYVRDARDYVTLAERAHGKIPRQSTPEYIWGEALAAWKEFAPDLKLINLETAVTKSESYTYGKGINYRMHPENLPVLKASGIDVCALANNHVLDWEEEGLLETLSVLDKHHIRHTGAGRNLEEARAPVIWEKNGERALIFSLCVESSGVPLDWRATSRKPGVFLINALNDESIGEVISLVQRYRATGDIIIVSIHWGGNWGLEVTQRQKSFAHALIDFAGVDIIHGHSSHHPKGIEIYQGRPVFYGCGDFINDYEGISGYEEFRGDLSLMYFLECSSAPFKLNSLTMRCLQMKRFQLSRPSLFDVNWMFETLTKASSTFSTKFGTTENNDIVFKPNDPWSELQKKISFLQPLAVETIETHLSYVFLTDGLAYKLKKPVHFSYLQLDTLESRRINTENEVRLNQELAPGYYLGVVPLSLDDNGEFHLGRTGAAGEVVDWLVKMKRFPRNLTLDRLIKSRTVSEDRLVKVARLLSRFYLSQVPVTLSPEDYRRKLKQYVQENQAALEQEKYELDLSLVKAIHMAQLDLLENSPALFDERVKRRKIVEGHGDLRPEHICLIEPPIIIDRLEFNTELRTIDPVDELAYLGLECELQGASEVGVTLLRIYAEITSDFPDERLVKFYRSFRAALRAKISLWHLDDEKVRDKEKYAARGQDYLNLAKTILGPDGDRTSSTRPKNLPPENVLSP